MALQRNFSRVLCIALALGGTLACFTGAGLNDDIGGAGSTTARGDGGTATAGDLPCDIAQLLVDKCLACHANPPIGTPLTLTSRADLATASRTDPTKTVAELSIARMRDVAKPMPPTGPSVASSATILESWVAAGMPAGSCGTTGAQAGPSPYDTPSVCTSKTTWTRGNRGSSSMRPGGACIDCHTQEGEGPRFSIAGTLYATAHEPADCNGQSIGVVVITDANGKVTELAPNAVGNFSLKTKIALPYRATVTANGRERVMATPQTSGDCNACHTEMGAQNAPGRIMAP